jgi:hypothetical protein
VVASGDPASLVPPELLLEELPPLEELLLDEPPLEELPLADPLLEDPPLDDDPFPPPLSLLEQATSPTVEDAPATTSTWKSFSIFMADERRPAREGGEPMFARMAHLAPPEALRCLVCVFESALSSH